MFNQTLHTRPRRLRSNTVILQLVAENNFTANNLVAPLFIEEGNHICTEIKSMPGIFRLSLDRLHTELEELIAAGIQSILLFGIPKDEKKDEIGSCAFDSNGIMPQAIRFIKKHYPQLYIMVDVCFCEYTNHGHCGVIKNQEVDNDQTLLNLQKQSLVLAQAGADLLAPSGMMDGAIAAMRSVLDQNNFTGLPIMAYAVKYASAFYGPFRDAVAIPQNFGNRRQYQMDPANSDEAIKEALLDLEQGADILMVKPIMSYLDVLNRLKNHPQINVPLAAYQVSGEYAMIKAAGKLGWIDEQKIAYETLLSIKRAGANIIITYFAKSMAKYLQNM